MIKTSLLKILEGQSVRSVILNEDDWLDSQSEFATLDADEFLKNNPDMKKTITSRVIDAVNRGLAMLKMPSRVKCTLGNYRNDYYGDHEDNYFVSTVGGKRQENQKALAAIKLLFDKCGINVHDEHDKGNAVRFLFDPIGSAVTEDTNANPQDFAMDLAELDVLDSHGHRKSYEEFVDELNNNGFNASTSAEDTATRFLYDFYLTAFDSIQYDML